MNGSAFRHFRKALALALIVLNLSGARVVVVAQPCERSRSYFAPSRSIKVVLKSALGQHNRQRSSHALDSRNRKFTQELKSLQQQKRVLPVVVRPPVEIAMTSGHGCGRILYAWKLPVDRHPSRSLLSKK